MRVNPEKEGCLVYKGQLLKPGAQLDDETAASIGDERIAALRKTGWLVDSSTLQPEATGENGDSGESGSEKTGSNGSDPAATGNRSPDGDEADKPGVRRRS